VTRILLLKNIVFPFNIGKKYIWTPNIHAIQHMRDKTKEKYVIGSKKYER